jgi:ribosomal peptide maturation radical SAM protein 1
MKKVLLVSMPFGALERPALGISLLKARLAESEVACDIRYLNITFAEFLGHDEYRWISNELPYTAFVGDWLFTRALYGEQPAAEGEYIQKVLRGSWGLGDDAIRRILEARKLTSHFLDHCLEAVPWRDYALVGFTSTFEQNIASLALARRLKLVHPELLIAFGGANWEAEMGLELHRQFPFVDYVCSGEAEVSFPELVKHVLSARDGAKAPPPIRGLVFRAKGRSIQTGQPEMIRDLDEMPIPDFSDYFHGVSQSTVNASVIPTLLYETSRGCWWGAKSHCTFCGLNGGTMAFRSKSPARAVRELEYLVDRWKVELVEAVDNILDMKYFRDVLPAFARMPRPVELFYEVKSNLTRSQVRLLREAGVRRIQPGIESLSDHILKLMRKGTTALRNIQLLKWCQEYGIIPEWNVLYGFPGERREDYRAMLAMLPAIRFLSPPSGCGPVRLDRFSPYFNSPHEFGLRNVRPLAAYSYLYPFGEESLSRIAYYFDFDYAPEVDPTGFAAEVVTYVQQWQRWPEPGRLSMVRRPDGSLLLLDSRSDATLPELALSGLEQSVYEYCDELRSRQGILQHLREKFAQVHFSEQRVGAFLDSLVAHRMMVTDGAHYLSLALGMYPPS